MEKYLNPKDPGDIARALVQFHIDEAIKNPWSATVLLKRAALILRRFIHFLRQLREQTSRFGHILITKLGLSVVATALVLALSSTPARAASINVDGVSCTLIDAITAANTDTATGGCSAGSGADTLFLAMGSTHSLVSINNYLNGHANGLPQISSQITIEGNSAIIERAEGAPPFRLFAVSSGNLTLNDVKVTGGESTGAGGAMLNNGGSLTINNSIISGNEAYSYGGGVANENSGTVVINNSTINNNVASDGGGISQNTQLGTTIVNDSTVSGNSGLSRGGGLWNSGGNLTLRNSTISGNEALGIGKGGGLYNFDGAVEINNATFAYNYANIGGGVYSYYGTLIFNRSLLVANDDNTDYANNVMSDYSQTTADNYNVFGNGNDPSIQGVYPGPTDILPGGSREEIFDIELQDNGSDTQTHALVSGSPAIDAIPAALCDAPTDQRGIPRPQGGGCDIGAFELEVSRDSDGDGIFNEVDTQPTIVSDGFSDTSLGGTTSGTIIGRGDQNLTVEEEPNPDGIRITAAPSGGATPATVSACGGAAELTLGPGDEAVATCSSVTIKVVSGIVEITFIAEDDTIATTSLLEPNSIKFEPTTLTFTAPTTNNGTVLFLVEGTEYTIDPGETINASNVAPTIDTLTVPLDPVNLSDQGNFTLDVTFSDPAGPLDAPYTCAFDLDNDGMTDISVQVTSLACSVPLNYTNSGVYTVRVTVTDKNGGMAAATSNSFLVVYNPDDGFATGGGWVWSPEGAYVLDPTLTGKANFGFVSKYKKGANVPTGNTQFVFQIADLNFHSSSYDWLVVNQGGKNAQFKGSGTINGQLAPNGEEYRFMLWAGDGESNTFRINIWWESEDGTEIVAYDNGFGQEIGGGNIVVHDGK